MANTTPFGIFGAISQLASFNRFQTAMAIRTQRAQLRRRSIISARYPSTPIQNTLKPTSKGSPRFNCAQASRIAATRVIDASVIGHGRRGSLTAGGGGSATGAFGGL